ncbi:MAG: PEP-CTERM sorting domain-containing protein [Phycisphaerae bacterium]
MHRTLLFFSAGCVLPTSAAFASPSLTGLGSLPGGPQYSQAFGVSDDGRVVVGTALAGGAHQPFRWTADGGMVGLGSLWWAARGFGTNADGSVVVGYSDSPSYPAEAFRWTAAGGTIGLGVASGHSWSQAYAVSDDGTVVTGVSARHSLTGSSQAFRWTQADGIQTLGDLPGGSESSWGTAINADGSVIVGIGTTAPDRAEPFRWTADTGMVGLGSLPGYSTGWAWGVSAAGDVVVGDFSNEGDVSREAFRWTPDGGIASLGDLPGGVLRSRALACSGDGTIVVGQASGSASWEAFLWTADTGMQRLWDVLLAHGVDPGALGWDQLTEATAISFDGNTIVGNGRRDGVNEGFVAVVPETATIVSLALAGLVVAARRWR